MICAEEYDVVEIKKNAFKVLSAPLQEGYFLWKSKQIRSVPIMYFRACDNVRSGLQDRINSNFLKTSSFLL